MRTFDFSPLYRSTVGFDRLFSLLDAATKSEESASSYPPFNIEVTGEDAYRVTMAVAGFGREDLTIEVRQNTLTISGKRETNGDERRYLHRGIAGRSFERRFELADHVKVANATLENGLLHVDLVREVPEEAKPRRVEIETGKGDGKKTGRVIDAKAEKAA
jgi:molecular chaperone IbpA